jgi:hypothetical protein
MELSDSMLGTKVKLTGLTPSIAAAASESHQRSAPSTRPNHSTLPAI